jgi:hypothetical protein
VASQYVLAARKLDSVRKCRAPSDAAMKLSRMMRKIAVGLRRLKAMVVFGSSSWKIRRMVDTYQEYPQVNCSCSPANDVQMCPFQVGSYS